MRTTLKVRYETDTWLAYVSHERGWQPIPFCRDESEIPTLEEACIADPITYLDPEDFSGVEVVV